MTDTGQLNLNWCDRIFAELTCAGVEMIFLAPGSRSTPLVLAAARRPELKLTRHFDERGLGFLALGYARATGKPAAVITTSGTAVANLLPAVVEAWQDHVPMILLTADRPPELRNTGSNQTINQVNIFGTFTRFFHDLPCPGDGLAGDALSLVVLEALKASRFGPSHLNVMLREPLQPSSPLNPPPPHARRYDQVSEKKDRGSDPGLEELQNLLGSKMSGWILAGPGLTAIELEFVRQFARRRGWVIIPDVLSPLRYEADDTIASCMDLLLLEALPAHFQPKLVMHLGDRLVSKRLGQYLAAHPKIPVWRISDKPNPIEIVPGRTRHVQQSVLEALDLPPDEPCSLRPELPVISRRVEELISRELEESGSLSEPAVARALTQWMDFSHTLFLGSSMPVRDVLMFGATRKAPLHVVANRGASGIDGTIASACGYTLGSGRPVTLLLGDLSTLHDLNSLALVGEKQPPLILVIINNRGGGIFKFLPPSTLEEQVGNWWTTPHQWSFGPAASMFNIPYVLVQSMTEFQREYENLSRRGTAGIIEVSTDASENVIVHHRLQEAVRDVLRGRA